MADAAKRAELDAELEAMRPIPDYIQARVLRWAADKHNVTPQGGDR